MTEDEQLKLGTLPGITRRLHLPDGNGGLTCYAVLSWDGPKPIRLQLNCNKQGSVERGLLHVLADVVTLALQHGVPLPEITARLKGVAFDPAGVTGDRAIPIVSSLADYLGRWLDSTEPPEAA